MIAAASLFANVSLAAPAPPSSASSCKPEIDVLAIKREKADLEGDTVQAKELLAREIRLLQELEQVTRQRRESGLANEADELRVRRQLLSLQRQQAELE